jgi:hypothetical protein
VRDGLLGRRKPFFWYPPGFWSVPPTTFLLSKKLTRVPADDDLFQRVVIYMVTHAVHNDDSGRSLVAGRLANGNDRAGVAREDGGCDESVRRAVCHDSVPVGWEGHR